MKTVAKLVLRRYAQNMSSPFSSVSTDQIKAQARKNSIALQAMADKAKASGKK